MYICRLFHRDQPFEQVAARLIAEGSMTIGRDPAADWPLADPEGLLSRIHCRLAVEQGQLLLTDMSTNGTFLDDGARAPRDVAVPIRLRETLRLGSLTLLVDQPPPGGVDRDATIIHIPLSSEPLVPPRDWAEQPATAEVRPAHRDESLLEAFCEGARLDASAFSGEDPVELMRRLGAIYQQTVLGLTTLISERTRLKSEHALDRTTIGAVDNNPFKWTAPRRLAQDLLCARDSGFLAGADAVRASIEDIGAHIADIVTGTNAAIAATLATLDPEAIADEAAAQGFSLRGRGASLRDVLARRHAALAAGGAVQAFRRGYAGEPPEGAA